MKIAVIGTGYVGLVSGTCFSDIGNVVTCCDVNHEKIEGLNIGEVPIYEPGLKELIEKNVNSERLFFSTDIPSVIKDADIIYIAVGTPMTITGEADLRHVYNVARSIGMNLNGYKIVVNKSTVPVGTGRLVERIIRENNVNPDIDFDVVSNPEFLREGSAISDFFNMERAIIGASNSKAAQAIADLHKPFDTEILMTDLESAELIKYASNSYLAMKISYINAISNICEGLGADVTLVAKGMGLDSRIGPEFLKAGIGYGGSCFPKDTHALVHMAHSIGYDFHLLRSVIKTNEEQKLMLINKVEQAVDGLKGKKIAVLGLAFKPNTDDMRDAPSLTIIPKLIQKGATVRGYDPVALHEARLHLGDNLSYYHDIYETVQECDACLILTEWDQVKNMDLMTVIQLMKNPIIIDGRNCFDTGQMLDLGVIYHSMGRPVKEYSL